MDVLLHPDAETELSALPSREYRAMQNALDKLEVHGDQLPFPHSSAVQGTGLRELRPRRGDSPYRAFYRRGGDAMLVGAVGPEASVDRRGFGRAVEAAEERIRELEARRATP